MKLLELFKEGEKVAEVDVTGFDTPKLDDLVQMQKRYGRSCLLKEVNHKREKEIEK